MGGGRSCSVVGCVSRSMNYKDKHFYRFPSDPTLRDVWLTFTRRGTDYKVKKSSFICQDHFDASCFVTKKKQVCLAKGTIPTIFYRNTAAGEEEKIVLTFDRDVLHYHEEDTLLNPVYDKDKHERDLLEKREEKLKLMRKLCRFCLEDTCEEKLISISKLKDYSINPTDIITVFGLQTEFEEMFSKHACEDCFQQIFVFDGYRKRCRKAQDRLLSDLKTLDKKITSIQGELLSTATPWFKTEMTWNDDDEEDENAADSISPAKFFDKSPDFHKIIVKEEREEENERLSDDDMFDDCHMQSVDEAIEEDYTTPELPSKEEDDEEVKDVIGSTKYIQDAFDQADIITHENTQLGTCRIYECFFCNLKFGGKPTFKKHVCSGPQQIKCNLSDCGKIFTKLSGYSSHITKIHRLPKITRLYCEYCKLSKVTTQDEYTEHRRRCEKKAAPENNPPITCEMCGKVCPNMRCFAIHMMFHTTGNKTFNVDDEDPSKPKSKWKKRKRGIFICETCGKEFATKRYLSDHVKRLHTVVKNPATYICDLCGKTRTTRGALYKHIKNVHTNDPSPCKVCGKVFRNIALLQAHMIYHKESKRIHFCPLCPDKPPYVTAVALKRHQESNHGFGNGYHCDVCDAVYKTRPGLSQHKLSAHEAGHSSLQRYL